MRVQVVNVEEIKTPWPIGSWPGNPVLRKVGLFQRTNFSLGIRGLSYKMIGSVGLSVGEIDTLTEEVLKEISDDSIRLFQPL